MTAQTINDQTRSKQKSQKPNLKTPPNNKTHPKNVQTTLKPKNPKQPKQPKTII
jgi:hypothetical protein